MAVLENLIEVLGRHGRTGEFKLRFWGGMAVLENLIEVLEGHGRTGEFKLRFGVEF